MITQERLKELLAYDPATGIFTRRIRTSNRVQIGDVAGTEKKYRYICLEGKLYLAHRLAWLYVYGEWPSADLDHEDENSLNNRISNLREATMAQNLQNTSKPYADNTSGYRGVSLHKRSNRWTAQIGLRGRKIHLGYFATPEQAHEAYLTAKRELHPFWTEKECNNSQTL